MVERVSIDPNRYKDFCVLLCLRFIENLCASASSFSILFLFSFWDPQCFLNSCGSLSLSPTSHLSLHRPVFRAPPRQK